MVKKIAKAPAPRPTKTMFAVRLDDAMRNALDKAAEVEGNTARKEVSEMSERIDPLELRP
jgi:hypothetical protein